MGGQGTSDDDIAKGGVIGAACLCTLVLFLVALVLIAVVEAIGGRPGHLLVFAAGFVGGAVARFIGRVVGVGHG